MDWPFRRRPWTPVLDAADAYALWAPRYDATPHNDLMRIEQDAVTAQLPDTWVGLAVDAGCGTGRYLSLLSRRGRGLAIGVDRSAQMLARAPAAATVVRADFRAMPLASATVDLIVSGLALMDVPDLGASVREWARILRPGGRLVYSVLHPRGRREGWVRTFAAPEGLLAVRAHWHDTHTHLESVTSAGLTVERVLEPGAPEPLALVIAARRVE